MNASKVGRDFALYIKHGESLFRGEVGLNELLKKSTHVILDPLAHVILDF